MAKFYSKKSGFTLVEVLVSLAIMLVFLPFAASMIANSQLLSSFSKHKMEAAYAAQQIIETYRQNPFITLTTGQSKTIGPSSVVLDTKGDYNSTSCGSANVFCGTAVVTVTPAVYTNSSGAITTSINTDHIVVSIDWAEQVANTQILMTDTYAGDILNDPMLN